MLVTRWVVDSAMEPAWSIVLLRYIKITKLRPAPNSLQLKLHFLGITNLPLDLLLKSRSSPYGHYD